MTKPQTLQQAIVYFADKNVAHDYLVNLRWSDGVVCPHCQSNEQHSYTTTRKIWRCKSCKKEFSVKVGTIFEKSPIGLDKWLSVFPRVLANHHGQPQDRAAALRWRGLQFVYFVRTGFGVNVGHGCSFQKSPRACHYLSMI